MSKKSTVLHIVSPLLLLAVSTGILTAAMIKPADKLKVFVNVAFMDSLKSDPVTDNTGLVIRENNITSDYEGETSDDGEIIRPAFGEQYAVLSYGTDGLEIPVYWGSNSELLEHGACQSSGSAIVGDDGNAVISAHVDTYFSDLSSLKEGDSVTVRTKYGEFSYNVRSLIEFESTDRRYITPKDDTRLTLYTCKKDLLGASDMRIGVICDLTAKKFYKEVQE